MHYPSGQRSSTKPHHHCHERRTRFHMRISCASEVLSVRIHQETSSHCCIFLCTVLWSSQFMRDVLCRQTQKYGVTRQLTERSYFSVGTFKVNFEVGCYFGDGLYNGEILSSDSFSLGVWSVHLPFPPSCFDTSRKTITSLNSPVYDFAWASCIFRIFVALAALVRFPLGPVDHEKFLSYFTKKGDLF